ncbi:MAG: MFS transporter [Acetobacteraceae bacterium]|nr:MFS transporter [Acetobacteraceae bacterium]
MAAIANARVGLAVIGLGTLVVPLDSMVNVAFPDIVQAFAIPIPVIQWVVISYVLTHASLMLVFGRLGDMVGHRRIFLAGAAVSAVAFVGCAVAPAYGFLLAARVAQGMGAALLLSCGPALATFLFPEGERARALGLYTAIFGLGGAVGPPLAGVLVEEWGWRAVYAVRVPLCVLAFVLAWRLPGAPMGTPAGGARERFDGVGAALMAVAITAALLAVNQARAEGQAGLALVLAGVAVVAAAGFVRQELRVERPIIDVRLFRDGGFAAINLGNVLINLAAFAVMLLAPFYLVVVEGLSVSALGLVLAGSASGMVVSAPLAGRLAGRIKARTLLVVGAGMVAVSLGLVAAMAGLWVMVPALVMQGVGLGLYQVAYTDIVARTLPLRARGVAGSLAMMTRTLGTVTGASVLMLVFQTGGLVSGFRAAFVMAATLSAATAAMLWWKAGRHE